MLTTWYSYDTPAAGSAPVYGVPGTPAARGPSGERRFTVYETTFAWLFHETMRAVELDVTVTPVGAATRCAGSIAGMPAASVTANARIAMRFIANSSRRFRV